MRIPYYTHCITNQPTNSMEQRASWEANSHSASQEIPPFMELEGSSPCSEEPTPLYY
jgi:hypothetical protein